MKESTKRTCAVASLVMSILSWAVLGIVLAPASVVTGILGIQSKEKGYKGIAIAGTIVGAAGCLMFMLAAIVLLSIYE